jgi:hypothetical protein
MTSPTDRIPVVAWMEASDIQFHADPDGSTPWVFQEACRYALARPEGAVWEGWQLTCEDAWAHPERRVYEWNPAPGCKPVLVIEVPHDER